MRKSSSQGIACHMVPFLRNMQEEKTENGLVFSKARGESRESGQGTDMMDRL